MAETAAAPGEEPIRAKRKRTRPNAYAQLGAVIVPNRDLTEREWDAYPPEVQRYLRDCGLYDVGLDPAEPVRAPPGGRAARRGEGEK